LSALKKGLSKARCVKLGGDFISAIKAGGRTFIKINPRALALLAEEAVRSASFLFPAHYLQSLRGIISDKAASRNDKFTAALLLENAAVSAKKLLPLCQDTGTVLIYALKGERVLTGCDDALYFARGARAAFLTGNFRNSQLVPKGLCAEENSGGNLPVQADIAAVPGAEYNIGFILKGGGSANRTELHAKSAELLLSGGLEDFLFSRLHAAGVSACPPYCVGFAIGGTSPELCVKTAALAAAGWLDSLPQKPGAAYRDAALERRLLLRAQKSGFGAQFGGKYLANSVRAVRMSRHAASVFVAMAVSCCAPRKISAKINSKGVWLEKLEENPARFASKTSRAELDNFTTTHIDLSRPMSGILKQFSGLKAGTRVLLSGPVVTARDIAHARFLKLLKSGKPLPDYLKRHPIWYAGPCKTPEGLPSGSCGPTTSSRMDGYMPRFLKSGAGLVTLGKGARGEQTVSAIANAGGVYLAAAGGAAAVCAERFITRAEIIDFPELGMEAVRRLELKNLPAFVAIDSEGGDIYHRFVNLKISVG